MPVNIKQWRACIGLFRPILGLQAVSGFRDLKVVNYKVIVSFVLLLFSHAENEVNPGPKRKLSKQFPSTTTDTIKLLLILPNCCTRCSFETTP